MRLADAQRVAVRVRREFVHGELGDLESYRDLDWLHYQSDRVARRNVERIAENVANAVIDIAKILLAACDIAVPGTYREVLEATVPAGLSSEPTAIDLVRLAQLRNALSHRYLDYKWEAVKWFLRDGSRAVERWLQALEERIAAGRTPSDDPSAASPNPE